MRVKKKIQIELKSDLCIASGYSYAGLIDNDICYDRWGIPYLPGRRLKGCLRDTAEKVLYSIISKECIEELFGVSYDDGAKGIIIENAYPKDCESLISVFESIKSSSEKGLKDILTSQRVLELYTTVKAQTRLDENGVAQNKTLRSIRTVNRYSFDKSEMIFEAYVTYESTALSEEYLPLIVSATKHIGLNRNRGLGNVRCVLTDLNDDMANSETEEQDQSTEVQQNSQNVCLMTNVQQKSGDIESVEQTMRDVNPAEDRKWMIAYCIKNIEPLILSNMSDDATETIIRGQSILGLLAAQYLRDHGNTADSEEFRDLFLNGNTLFSNLVISKNGCPYYPAPLIIRKLKKSDKYVNVEYSFDEKSLRERHKDSNDIEQVVKDLDPSGGNQPKKLAGKYLRFDRDFKIDVAEVERKLVYHHSRKGANRYGEEPVLYATEAIAENQEFFGTVILPAKYVEVVVKLLTETDIRVGKSKTAQYGKCVLKYLKHKKYDFGGQMEIAGITMKKGDPIAVIVLSDAIFLYGKDEQYDAHCTVFRDEVEQLIIDELKNYDVICSSFSEQDGCLSNHKDGFTADKEYISYIETIDIAGYNTHLNLRKAAVPAIKAGSVICLQLEESASCIEGYIGEKNHEGYGHIAIVPLSQMKYEVECIEDNKSSKSFSEQDIAPSVKTIEHIIIGRLEEAIRAKALKDVTENTQTKSADKLSASTVGRVTLMLRESMKNGADDRHREQNVSDKDFNRSFSSFYGRVESIKRQEERKIIREVLLEKVADSTDTPESRDRKNWTLSAEKIQSLIDDNGEDCRLLEKIGLPKGEIDDCIMRLWSEYIRTVLTLRKYLLADK